MIMIFAVGAETPKAHTEMINQAPRNNVDQLFYKAKCRKREHLSAYHDKSDQEHIIPGSLVVREVKYPR